VIYTYYNGVKRYLGSLESKPPINHVEELSRGLIFVALPLHVRLIYDCPPGRIVVVGNLSDHNPKAIT